MVLSESHTTLWDDHNFHLDQSIYRQEVRVSVEATCVCSGGQIMMYRVRHKSPLESNHYYYIDLHSRYSARA